MKPQTKRKSFPFNAPQPGGVMEFGFNFNANGFGNPSLAESECGKWQHKRKSEQQATVLPPKMLITEERITQHFSGLQISGDPKNSATASVVGNSNNNSVAAVTGGLATDDIPSTSTGKTHHPNPAYQMAAMELEQKLRNANRIVICDGLKPGTGPGATGPPVIPPEWLLKTIPRPCTALVPWQPSPLQLPLPEMAKISAVPQNQPLPAAVPMANPNQQELDDYDDDLEFFENNNTCSVNLNKSDEHMDEDL
ncbi:uncharacterized protein Mst85C [Drosophila kikkawai]|uniref:Uncharacterized protein Mst85C n=1 Tax=Drosophila kikkawai TaxID=30033 RepID=A0A6P4HSL4_DROKI|nr:uncharacterized protein LOC108072064 [Drosophila kikkawai]KAH8308463.1 hypothetical protein KR059_013003 [Drosophila kikkawai]